MISYSFVKRLIRKYDNLSTPCSLKVSSIDDLLDQALKIYQVSYANYVIGKNKDINGTFPDYCCGVSSWNVLFSLFKHEYPMVSIATNLRQDHVYPIIPFILNNEKSGVIVIDPTSDQLWRNLQHPPRNSLFIVSGLRWEYNTQWSEGNNLYPESVVDISSIKSMLVGHLNDDRNFYTSYNTAKSDVPAYFHNAFSNSVSFQPV